LANAVRDYFRSHLASSDRTARLNDLIAQNSGYLKGKTLYIGVINFQRRVPRVQKEFPNETKSF